MDAFAAYTEFTMDIITKRRAEPTRRPVLHSGECRGRRSADVRRRNRHGDAADPHRRRRDHPAHAESAGTEQLVRHRDQWDALVRDPSLLPGAIEEMLRWTSPVKNMCRTLTADTEFHGTALREGEKIMLLFESANFDESQFDRPGQLRYPPRPQRPHGIRLRHALLPGQSAGPAGAVDDDRAGAQAATGSAAGRRRLDAAAAAGELRQWLGSRCRWCSRPSAPLR